MSKTEKFGFALMFLGGIGDLENVIKHAVLGDPLGYGSFLFAFAGVLIYIFSE